MSKPKHSDCPYCGSEQTIPLRNYGKQIGNQYQCLNCKKNNGVILVVNEEVLHLIVNVKI